MANSEIISQGTDGYYHPKSEDEVIALVNHAIANKLQIRTRGASHSMAWSIFTDPVDNKPDNMTLNKTPPAGPNLNLAMDRMNGLDWIDEAAGIVEAGPGIHLGEDPYDPLGPATMSDSLLMQIWDKGWAVDDLGGITHQTLSGFTATGSAGGSLTHSFDNIIALRVVDGSGQASWIEKEDPIFPAMILSVGLLGIITRVRLQLVRAYNVYGQEVTAPTTQPDCPIDLFGPGSATKPSMRGFLEGAPYSRMGWWPQKGAERVVIWQAVRVDCPRPQMLEPVPYQEFDRDLMGWIKQLIGSIFFILLGNSNPLTIFAKLARSVLRFGHCVAGMWSASLGPVFSVLLAAIVTSVLALLLVVPILVLMIPGLLPMIFPFALGLLQPITKKGKPTVFEDYYWRSLPMDNTADDILLGTEFTEIWVPVQHTEKCMNLLADMFASKGAEATGYYSTEVYASTPSTAWISPGYSDGNDEYKDGVVRFDVFWFRGNDGKPNDVHGFFRQYWDLFLANGIPFRFHWGKFIPTYDFSFWADHYRKSLPRLGDFLALREARDPHGIFFTRYWRQRLTGTE